MVEMDAQVEGVVSSVVFSNEETGFTVLELIVDRKRVSAVGILPFVREGERVLMQGQWVNHPDYGRQIKVESCETVAPSTLDGMEKYLASGLLRGVGPATARAIVKKFGLEALDVIQYSPNRLCEVAGIGESRAEMIADSFAAQRELREVMLFLQTYGVPASMAVRIHNSYGKNSVALVKENPYRLAEDVEGIGFLTADRIAMQLGISPNSPFRQASAIKHILSRAVGEGHTCFPQEEVLYEAGRLVSADEQIMNDALALLLLRREVLREHEDEGGDYLYLPWLYRAENGVAGRLHEMAEGLGGPDEQMDDDRHDDLLTLIDRAQRDSGLDLSDEQREAVLLALTQPVVVITGGPGTGKTTIIHTLLCVLDYLRAEVLLAAPTGRAAKRMAETTGREAKTLHRLLEYGYSEDGEGFQRNADYPLECDVLVVDEMSMVDILLMHRMMDALPEGARLVLVGDADQLPSVGPGSVLGDIIHSGSVRAVHLSRIYRQGEGSSIPENARLINTGQMPVCNQRGGGFFFEHQERATDILKTVVSLCATRLPGFAGLEGAKDIQVLSPMRKGEAGVLALNHALQQALNPPSADKQEYQSGERVLREGDKVMQIKNNYNLTWERVRPYEEGTGVFNGDMGVVQEIDEQSGSLTVLFDDDRVVEYAFNALNELELAYCVSVHKSQGSEFPCVVVPLTGGPPMLFTRNLLYTAITRARTLVVLVGRQHVLEAMIANNHIQRRYSLLRQRLSPQGAN